MTALLTFLSGWQLKVFLVLFLLFGGYTWHKVQVQKAVIQATTELQLKHSKEVFRQVELARNETIKLRQEKEKLDNEYKKSMAAANANYNALASVLSSRPYRQDNAGASRDGKDTPRTDGRGLYRDDAEFLGRFARNAEEMKIRLQQCYSQYDKIRERLNE